MSEIDVINPFDLKKITTIPLHSSDDVEAALAKADTLFHDRQRHLSVQQRVDILLKTKSLMEQQVDDLTRIAATEGGKPYADSKVEVLRAINGVQLAIEHIAHNEDQFVPMGHTDTSANRLAINLREPIGVATGISAFNHPLNLIVHQTIPAIAVGCPVIIKPDLRTPMSCLRLVKILYEAGLPEDWCQALICENDAAEQLVTDPRVRYFSFIGSARVGWYLRSKLAPGTRCALEHGGAAPAIVDADVDFAQVVPSLLKGGFYHAGQVCVSVQRVFVHESISHPLAEKLAVNAMAQKVGDPLDKETEVGPLILPRELERIESWVENAVAAGAQILCGGERLSETCYKPTVLLDPPLDCEVSTQEIFGPVVCVYSYRNREEAIAQANSLPYAFQAAVYSQNLDVAMDCAKKLDATAVMINDHTAFRVDWMPFGGRKQSGLGMGGIPYSMHELTQTKMIVMKSPGL